MFSKAGRVEVLLERLKIFFNPWKQPELSLLASCWKMLPLLWRKPGNQLFVVSQAVENLLLSEQQKQLPGLCPVLWHHSALFCPPSTCGRSSKTAGGWNQGGFIVKDCKQNVKYALITSLLYHRWSSVRVNIHALCILKKWRNLINLCFDQMCNIH